MRHRRPTIATLIVFVCLIVTAGCGASTTAQFKSGYAAARAPLNRTFVEVAKTFKQYKGKTAAQLGRRFGTLAVRFGQDLAPLEALKPPPRVATAFATLTACLNRVETDLRGASKALKGNDVVAAAHSLEDLTSDASAATDAATAVTKKLADR
jgi:hypothetical protein